MEKKALQNNNKKVEMEFGVRIATHSILKELNNDVCHEKNLVFSPLSLHICLNLLTAGAKGPTLDQLLRFLNAENIAQLNSQSSRLMEFVTDKSGSSDKRDEGPILSMVNGIWVDLHLSLKNSFKHLADEIYNAKSQSLDFNKAEQVADEINAWTRESSKGHIDNIVTSDSLQGSILVLANALYFKGSWVKTFEPSDTKEEDFFLLDGKRVRVPFMKLWQTLSLYRSMGGFQILKMGYKEGEDNKSYAMHIFLPDQHDGLPELIQKFHSDPRFFIQDHGLHYVNLSKLWLPKLKFEYGHDMKKNIMELGLNLPFEVKADLTEIVDQSNVFVSKAIQKSYIEVNEEGTVATSVTLLDMRCGAAPGPRKPPPPINFVADHPFLFVIKEEVSGIVLFVGAALNPLSGN